MWFKFNQKIWKIISTNICKLHQSIFRNFSIKTTSTYIEQQDLKKLRFCENSDCEFEAKGEVWTESLELFETNSLDKKQVSKAWQNSFTN